VYGLEREIVKVGASLLTLQLTKARWSAPFTGVRIA
jgi:hypothetical protein